MGEDHYGKEQKWRKDTAVFLRKIIRNWVAWMGGSIMTFSIAAATLHGQDLPLWIFVILGLAGGLVFASFSAWQEERDRRVSEIEYKDGVIATLKKSQQPLLRGRIEHLVCGDVDFTDGSAPKECWIFMLVTILNTGAPSIAEMWKLLITLPGGVVLSRPPNHIHENMTFGQGDHLVKIGSAMQNQRDPVLTGGKISGWLFFDAPLETSRLIISKKAKVEITFCDAAGASYKIESVDEPEEEIKEKRGKRLIFPSGGESYLGK